MPNDPKKGESTTFGEGKPPPSTPAPSSKENSTSSPKSPSERSAVNPRWKIILEWVGCAGGVITIIGFLYGIFHGFDSMLDNAIDKRLSDPGNLRKIAEQSRPSLIFNAAGSIVDNMGAIEWIEPNGLKVIAANKVSSNAVGKVHIEFKKHLQSAPIVTPIGDVGIFTASRGEWLSWDFKGDLGSDWERPKEEHLYRLEIIP